MHQSSALAKRYGEAWLAVLKEANAVEAARADLELLKAVLAQSELEKVLGNPNIEAKEKKQVLVNAFKGKIHDLTLRLLDLLLDKRRGPDVPEIVQGILSLLDENAGVELAEAIVPFDLPEALVQKLQKNLETLTGKTIRLSVKIDPSILGGITVRVGDRLMDGSFRTYLVNLRQELKRARVA